MDKYFYDKQNFDNINNVIDQTVFKKTGYHVDQKHAKLVYQLMDYIYNNTNKPDGIRKKQYLTLLNHNVLRVAIPKIETLTNNENLTNNVSNVPNMSNVPNVSAGNMPQMTMNVETRKEFNFNDKLEKMQNSRHNVPQNAMQNNDNAVHTVTDVSDNSMSAKDSMEAYERLLAERNNSMSTFENQQNKLNSDVEKFSENVEQFSENVEQQFQPILEHPAVSQSSDLNNMLSQDVDTLLSKRLDTNTTIPQFGNFNGVMENGLNGQNKIEAVIEKMVGYDVDKIDDIDLKQEEKQNMNAFKQQMVIPPVPQEKYIRREYYVNIDSRDRDLEVYPDVNKFQIQFSPSSDSQEVFEYRDVDGNILYQTKKNFIGNGHGAALPDIYKNIHSIECVSAIVPYDVSFVCGICPYEYNSYKIDENKVSSANQFTSWPYGPVFNEPTGVLAGSKLGITTSVLDEPYMLLNVDELVGNTPYIGTNKATTNTFAKLLHDGYFGVLTSFIQLKTDHAERKVFRPHALGTIDKMTLNLVKHNGIHYNFGIDKTFIKRFEAVDDDECSTKVIIIPPDDECGSCSKSHGHCLRPGNLLYYYDTMDCVNNEIKFYDNVKGKFLSPENLGQGSDTKVTDEGGSGGGNLIIGGTIFNGAKQRNINFQAFLEVGDYMMIEVAGLGKHALKINKFETTTLSGTLIYLERPSSFGSDLGEITNFGFYKKNMKGITSERKGDFNYIDGLRVCSTESADYEDSDGVTHAANNVFTINFPFSKLPERLQNKDLQFKNSLESEIFYIKKKLQVSYTFRITVLEKDINKLHSSMI